MQILLPPAMKFGQGYIFTGMCDSVHRGGVWSGPGGVLQFLGVSNFLGGLQFFGGSPIFFFFFQFFSPKFLLGCTTPPRQSMRGRYASYWNAFLLEISVYRRFRYHLYCTQNGGNLEHFQCANWLYS